MSVRRLAAFVLVLVMGSGCRTWYAVPHPSQPGTRLAPESRVIRTDGARIEIEGGAVTADSIVGAMRGARVAVPLDSVARVEVRRVSRARTFIMVAGPVVAMSFLLMYTISGSEALPY